MGCGCGSGRTAVQYSSNAEGKQTPIVWRLHYGSGGTVDYWSENRAREDLAKRLVQEQREGWTGAPSRVSKTDPRTGAEIY